MEKELKKLGIKLAQIAKKYNEDYISLSFVRESIVGCNSPNKQNHISIFINKEELEEK